MTLEALSEAEIEQLFNAGALSDADIEQIALQRLSPEQLARIDAFAYGLARLLNTPINQLVAEAQAARGTYDNVTCDVPQGTFGTGESPMHAAHVGAEGSNYPEIASHAIRRLQHRSPAPVYGYRSAGIHQKIYLFQTLEDAGSWLAALASTPIDYAAVFVSTDLSHPVPGMEIYGRPTATSDTTVGSLLPFLLGLPIGAAGGYLLRRWQEVNPGRTLPGLPAHLLPAPGAPSLPATPVPVQTKASGDWYDLDPIVGGWIDLDDASGPLSAGGFTIGSWRDLVGAQQSATAPGHPAAPSPQRRAWSKTRALIQSAIREVTQAAQTLPAAAYVWSLDPPGAADSPSVTLEGTTGIMSFNSVDEALGYMRDRIQTPHVALALFNRGSAHWPNPTNWTKSDDPSYVPYIDQQIANQHVQVSGVAVGSALEDVRSRARALAGRHAGRAVGVIHTTRDGLWHTLAFRNADDADDWLGIATQDPTSFTYAAYYDKDDVQWPHPVNEKIGGSHPAPQPGSLGGRGVATTSGWWST